MTKGVNSGGINEVKSSHDFHLICDYSFRNHFFLSPSTYNQHPIPQPPKPIRISLIECCKLSLNGRAKCPKFCLGLKFMINHSGSYFQLPASFKVTVTVL